jgi:acylphosphatase
VAQRALRPRRLRVQRQRRRPGGGIARALRAQARRAGLAEAIVAAAHEHGVLGWVREDDGTTAVHLEGPDEGVAHVRALLGDDADEQRAKVEGHEQFAVRGVPAGAFAVRAHARGYELELEVAGVARAWTLRREPSLVPADKRMAIELAAPQGEGEAWDGGAYEQGGRVPWPEAIERGHAVFVLHGERLRGGWALQRTRGRGPGAQWLLVKRRDEHAL